MSKNTHVREVAVTTLRLSWTRTAVLGSVCALLLLGIYAPVFVRLVRQWWNNPDYSHGFLVPLAAAYFGWRKRNALARLDPQPTQWGLAVLAASQCVLLVGHLGAELFLQRVSFLLFLAGSVLFLYGWRHLRILAFPLVLLLFMIPLPAILFNAIAAPLQLIASRWAEVFLQVCQVPVLREGNILILARQSLNVTEACSGIRSLISLLTLTLVLAYFLPAALWLRGLFVLSVLPITLLTNSLRVAGTGLLGHFWSAKAAEGFFHLFSGWLIFVLAFALLFAESIAMERWQTWRDQAKGDQ